MPCYTLLYIVVHWGILDNNEAHWISVSDSWRPLCSGKSHLLEYIKIYLSVLLMATARKYIVLVEATMKL